MDAAVKYALENIEQTKQIRDTIEKMDEEVWSIFDEMLISSFADWFGEQWFIGNSTLGEYGIVWASRNDLRIETDRGDESALVSFALEVCGEDPVWSFLGLGSGGESGMARVWLTTRGLKEAGLADFKKRSDRIDETLRQELQAAGYKHKTAGNCHWYCRDGISFDSRALLAQIDEGGNADVALKPLREAWQVLVDLDWDRIANIALAK